MYQCPHCRRPGVTYLRKWWSFSTNPARCVECRSLSYVPDTVANAIFSAGLLSFVLTVLAALTTGSWLLGSVFFAVSIAFYGLFWHEAKLRATTDKQVAAARNLNWGMLILAGIVGLFN